MNAPLKILAAGLVGLLVGLPAAQAQDDFIPVTDVLIKLGTAKSDSTIQPREITLQAGELYRFVVSNTSKSTHIVAVPEFRKTVFTAELVKWYPLDYPVAVLSPEISLQPGDTMEWTFIALKEGTYKLGCDDPVHAAAGMHAIINVVS